MSMAAFGSMVIVLVLIGAANTAPLIAKKLLGTRFSQPADAGWQFFDGRPLFGKSKTLRGLLVGVTLPALLAPLLGAEPQAGLAIGIAAMLGDLLSSFTKRRLGLAPSSQAMGLDQIPEVLLPAWIARGWFGLSVVDVCVTVIAFVVLALLLSKLLFHFNLRDKPY